MKTWTRLSSRFRDTRTGTGVSAPETSEAWQDDSISEPSSSGSSPRLFYDAYQPLTDRKSRLVNLLPGTWSDPITIELRTFSLELDKLPFYEAVSYTWGYPVETATVTCSGRPLRVSKSAEDLMRRFRLADTPRLLWIDALCINQEDDLEKVSQIQLMDKIYQQASRVLIYLGEAESGSNNVMDSLAQRHSDKYSTQRAVLDFFQRRPWFNRVWVLQEVALADCALTICGSKCVPWACFPAWWARNAALLEDSPGAPGTLSYDPIAIKRSSLLQQLHDTRLSRATDPRDKVYALIGLLSPEDKMNVLVDYRETVASVYNRTAVAIMKRERSLRALSAIQPVDDKEHGPQLDGMPSWVPDWSRDTTLVSLGLSNMFLEPYDAGGRPACGLNFDERNGCRQLHCLGIKFDVVDAVGEIFPVKATEEAIVFVLNKWNRLVLRTAQHPFPGSHQRGNVAVLNSSGLLWPADMCSGLWPTILAQPTPTLELTMEEKSIQKARPAKLEDLKFSAGRRLLVTKMGSLGLAPPAAKLGDVVAVLIGAPVPHILRPQVDGSYKFIGECFIHEIMGGEALAHLGQELEAMGHRCRPHAKSKSDAKLTSFTLR